ncbi:hypothetical protein JCM10908_003049 [Rhodotorula pacifica]|uniref:urease accessory protein UreF n=1 Tax=Rhodotorula pacifica TaxID=1495444 RepID=UPI0031791042
MHDSHYSAASSADLDRSLEDYLLLVLSDSNLPTGGFVASSGLESWLQHGYASIAAPPTGTSAAEPDQPLPPPTRSKVVSAGPINAFVSRSLHSYARLNAPMVRQAHAAVSAVRSRAKEASPSKPLEIETAFYSILTVDVLCETMTLNHVARRASVAQGVALLTLYDRAFAPPLGSEDAIRDEAIIRLVARYRNAVKMAEDGCNGHMSVAFGVLTAAIGVGIDAALHLFLFLHARSLLSSAVRMNSIGPYLAHRMLVNDTRQMITSALSETDPTPTRLEEVTASGEEEEDDSKAGDWWDDDPEWRATWTASSTEMRVHGTPTTTWPLGEVVASRHDQLFSKVFNS